MLSEDENEKLLKEEMEVIKDDLIKAYEASGKKTTGEFANGLETLYQPNKAILFGYEYLGGRRAGKMPPIQAIEDWIKAKGIKPIEDKMSTSTLAYLIARKISLEGTKKENNLAIYSQVITPERIQSIMDKISNLNANAFITDVTGTITKAFNSFQ